MIRVISLAVGLLLLGGSNMCAAQEIVAHRGASSQAPENTLAAFELAWEQSADAIEGDFYLTGDGHIVCIHDKSTKWLAPNSAELSVPDATLAQLRQLDVGSWKDARYAGERIPLLEEVLSTIPAGKRILIEIKCGVEILAPLKKQLASSSLNPDQVIIIAFSKEVVTQARVMMPQYKANWLTSYKKASRAKGWTPSALSIIDTLKQTGATGLGSKASLNVIDLAFANAIRAAGFELHVWTVNDNDDAVQFTDLGVNSITTDKPAEVRRAIQNAQR